MIRPLCVTCKENPAAINYKNGDTIHYRSECATCIRKKRNLKPQPPAWIKSGYRKKQKCDKCGFVASNVKTQMRVYHIDGNLKNNDWTNLKTICLNCQAGLQDAKTTWKPADLVADY